MALSLPEAAESSHMNHPDFRVRGKVFATLGYPDRTSATVMLTPEQQDVVVEADPMGFAPVKGGWGKRGATNVLLKSAEKASVREALIAAWCKAAPKTLSQQLQAPLPRPAK
jgi:hypothetical protein